MTAELERRLSALQDIRAIEILKWRYLRACDRKQPQVVRDCFVPERRKACHWSPLLRAAKRRRTERVGKTSGIGAHSISRALIKTTN